MKIDRLGKVLWGLQFTQNNVRPDWMRVVQAEALLEAINKHTRMFGGCWDH